MPLYRVEHTERRVLLGLAGALDALLRAYAYPKEPALFAACERAAKRAKRALARYYRYELARHRYART